MGQGQRVRRDGRRGTYEALDEDLWRLLEPDVEGICESKADERASQRSGARSQSTGVSIQARTDHEDEVIFFCHIIFQIVRDALDL